MNNLAIKENVKVCGIEVPNISGGFGEDKKAMLVRHIAEIHNKELKRVNELINDNITRFKNNVDIIDVKKQDGATDLFLETGILTKAQVGNAKNIYLLSERGYAKLIKLFNDDKSWELYDQLLDEYFELRDGQSNSQPMSQAELLLMYAQQFVNYEKKLSEIDSKVVKMTDYLTETPDRKKVNREIKAYARKNNLSPGEVSTLIYNTLGDKYGIDIMQRVENKRKNINEERLKQGLKPYAESTLKSKYNGIDWIIENDMLKDMMEILAGLS